MSKLKYANGNIPLSDKVMSTDFASSRVLSNSAASSSSSGLFLSIFKSSPSRICLRSGLKRVHYLYLLKLSFLGSIIVVTLLLFACLIT